MLIMAAGIRPNTGFLENTGIEMFKGTILVDGQMKTNLDDVYAAGDCVMVTNRITGKRQWSPMGSSANMEGRTLAQVLAGAQKTYPGVLGTGVVKLPGLNVGRTGLTEAQAKEAGYDVITALVPTDDKAHYYPDASFFITKVIADKTTRKLLGVQVFGPGEVDKMVDIAVMGINMGCQSSMISKMRTFAYAPPFSTAIHPFVQAVYVLMNKIDGTIRQHDAGRVCGRSGERISCSGCSARAGYPRSLLCESGSGERRGRRARQGREAPACMRKRKESIFPAEQNALLWI